MTPFEGNILTVVQRIFNDIVVPARSLIERTIGLLKVRFRCISGERQLRYHQSKVSKIINTCAALHNYLLLNGFDIFHGIDGNALRAINNNQVPNVNQNLNLDVNRLSGEYRRNELAEHIARQMQIN